MATPEPRPASHSDPEPEPGPWPGAEAVPAGEAPAGEAPAGEAPGNPAGRRVPGRGLGIGLAAGLVLVLGLAVLVASRGGVYAQLPWDLPALAAAEAAALPPGEAARVERRLRALAPRGPYVLVDTHHNRLRLVRNGEVLHEAVCSSGSGTVLRDPESGREWIFDSPLGERQVVRKVKDPVWVKPDWAFIEEGYAPPPKGSVERYDRISLGDYGLYLGDGFIIHGTLFQTLLGRRITHGCIRLGDKDLEYVYKNVPLGSRVYLY